VSGFERAKEKIQEALQHFGLSANIHICDPLSDSDRAFSEQSGVFPLEAERDKAKSIAHGYGIKLEPKQPLGHADCQAAVVFDCSCPNNTLPIIWAEAKDWVPLFKRL
jgi:hypothetical protein